MTLNYQELMCREADIVRQLHCLQSMLPEDEQDQYPQLFDNEDSLFSPDAMLGGVTAKQQFVREGEQESGVGNQKQMFEQYLDSLEINQFIKLQREQGSSKAGTKSLKNLQNSLECTFKPTILKKSNQLAGNMQPSFERLTSKVNTQRKKSPYQPQDKQLKKTYSKERIERLSKPRIMKTQPSENVELKKESVEKKYYVARHSNNLDVAARNQLWQEQKNQKIKKLREEEQANRLKKQSSTFAPKIIDYKGEKGANISQFGKQGIANYFQRVNMAKQKQPAKENLNTSSYAKELNRRDSISPYSSSNLTKTPRRESIGVNGQKTKQQKVKYEDAVKELHKKLMSLNI